jgi:hypothetical protein
MISKKNENNSSGIGLKKPLFFAIALSMTLQKTKSLLSSGRSTRAAGGVF